jgi:hypothetical protein
LIPLKVKGEEAPKGGLQRKINADSAESKTSTFGNITLHSITSLHHSHSITSYIILHQQCKEGDPSIDIRKLFRRKSGKAQKIAIEELYFRQMETFIGY